MVARGRCFIRVSLCQKLITVPIEHLVKNERHTNYWYSRESLIGDQALRGMYVQGGQRVLTKYYYLLNLYSITDAATLSSD